MSNTASELASQWMNPSDVTAVLMIIGGDVVQKALAQTAGWWYTPVCFSFGWVAYAFMSLINVLGNGRLLPEPDYPVKVFNLDSGYGRDNRNWVIGRLMRDHEARMARTWPISDYGEHGIRISIWEARKNRHALINDSYSTIHIWGLAVMVIQLIVATIPVALYREWGTLLVTTIGTLLAIATGMLPQWRAEKLPNRQDSRATFALTGGNGTRDILVIMGEGRCFNLEELSVSDSPRKRWPWKKFQDHVHSQNAWSLSRKSSEIFAATSYFALPTGFLITRSVCIIQSIFWLLLLVTVTAVKSHTWYLLLVGSIGMFQNGFLAAMERQPQDWHIPLEYKTTIRTYKVMDGLMDLHILYGQGRLKIKCLVDEFFPGQCDKSEEQWWQGDRTAYDAKRRMDQHQRGPPLLVKHPGMPVTAPSFDENSVQPPVEETTDRVKATIAAMPPVTAFQRPHTPQRQRPQISAPQSRLAGQIPMTSSQISRSTEMSSAGPSRRSTGDSFDPVLSTSSTGATYVSSSSKESAKVAEMMFPRTDWT